MGEEGAGGGRRGGGRREKRGGRKIGDWREKESRGWEEGEKGAGGGDTLSTPTYINTQEKYGPKRVVHHISILIKHTQTLFRLSKKD